jgi:hypothetical protein
MRPYIVILSQLLKPGLPVLVVPTGRGNDFARPLELRRVRHALTAWRRFCAGQENVRVIDLGIVTPAEDAGGAAAPHEPSRNRVLGANIILFLRPGWRGAQ